MTDNAPAPLALQQAPKTAQDYARAFDGVDVMVQFRAPIIVAAVAENGATVPAMNVDAEALLRVATEIEHQEQRKLSDAEKRELWDAAPRIPITREVLTGTLRAAGTLIVMRYQVDRGQEQSPLTFEMAFEPDIIAAVTVSARVL